MQPIRVVARPMVAAYFVVSGLETLRDPHARAEQMAPTLKPIADRLDWLPTKDPETLVRLQAMVNVGAGTLLAMGRFKRLSTLLLAVSLAPSVATEHQYWTEDDPDRRETERAQLLLKGGLLGALIMVATEPRRSPRLADLRRQAQAARTRAAVESRALRRQTRTELRQTRREAARRVHQARREAARKARR